MNIEYHYPTDLLQLLIETIPLLCKAKRDVLMFFTSAGIDDTVLEDLKERVRQDKDSISKYEIVRVVLTRLNERGELALRERREILRRVVEREDYSTCWEDDRLKAQGLVAQIQKLVNAKDTLTKINLEREAERKQRLAEEREKREALQRQKAELAEIYRDLCSLFGMTNPHKRGKKSEKILNRLFRTDGLSVREDFTVVGSEGEGIVEQIDGVVDINKHFYLVEMKWWKNPLGVPEVSEHLVRIYHRGQARGIFISESGYSDPAIRICREALQRTVVVLCELQEIISLLEQGGSLMKLLEAKIEAAMVDKNPLYRPLSSNYL